MSAGFQQPDASLRRVLGPFDAACIVVGAVIGVGIFFTPHRVALVAGSASMALTAWIIGGVIALLGALTFAELGALYIRSGGQYEILRDAYGPFPAFLFVFCNATAVQAGAVAIIAVICAQNLAVALNGRVGGESSPAWLATTLIFGVMLANILGVRFGSIIQNITTIAKVGTLLAVTVLAALSPGHPSESLPATSEIVARPLTASLAICASLVPTLFSYGGWQHILWIAGEVREPQRNVPRAIIGGMIVVVGAYVLVNWAYLHLLGHADVAQSRALAADAVATVWPAAGRRAVAAAVAISAFGVLNAQLLSGPRLVYGMALDGRFFRPFARIGATFETPYAAIVLIGGMALLLLHAAGHAAVDKLVNGVVAIDGTFFALTGAALFVLRRKMAHLYRPIKVPGYPVVPLIFVAAEAAVVAGAFMNPDVRQAAVIGLVWIAAAALCYAICFRGKT